MKRNIIYIIGHKNPDLDSVASALAYEDLKKRCGETNVTAATPGAVNHETRYVLSRLGLSEPLVVADVRARVEDLLDDEPGETLQPGVTLREFGRLVRDRGQKTFPVLDSSQRLLGIVTVGDLAAVFMSRLWGELDHSAAGIEVHRILNTLVGDVMKTENLVVFEVDDPVGDARQMMLKTRYRNYPVIDLEHRYRGMISRYHLLQMRRKQVILVDHNERRQAVDGIEEADLLEVIDHHRVGGDLESINPIYFRNEPVGATSTLIAEIYQEKNLIPGREMAGLLLAGILSDTMIFRSPTTTEQDRDTALYLSRLSGLEIERWGREIFREASPLNLNDLQGMVTEDLKEYSFGDVVFAVAQIETADLNTLKGAVGPVREAMEEVCAARGYDLMLLMITDVLIEGTQLLIAGPKSELGTYIFGAHEEKEVFLPGMMSRKKQVVPAVYRALARRELAL